MVMIEYATVADLKPEWWVEAIDADGLPLNAGDLVEILVDKNGFKRGDQGIIKLFIHDSSGLYCGIDFGKSGDSWAQDLQGHCPARHGSWLQAGELRKVVVTSEDEEAAIQQLVSTLTTGESAFIGGKLFTLTAVEKPESNALLQSLLDRFAAKFRAVRAEMKTRINAERSRAEQTLALPNISFGDVARGLSVFKDGDCINYVLPFHYEPKFLGNGESLVKAISNGDREKLIRDVFMVISVNKTGQVQKVGTYSEKTFDKPFSHYHGSLDNCVGTLGKPKIEKMEDLFHYRNDYEKMLQTVKTSDRMSSNPPGLLSYDTLNENAVKLDKKEVWKTPKTAEEEALGEIKVGSVCLMTADYEHAKKGLIGKVVYITSHVLHPIGLEFLPENPNMHACEGHGRDKHCYFVPQSWVRLLPPGTRRNQMPEEVLEPSPAPTTRRPWVAATETPITSPITLVTQFAVGDRVKVKDGITPSVGWTSSERERGHVGTIESITGGDIRIDFGTIDGTEVHNWLGCSADLEKVEE
mgnify:FL=1